MMADSVSNLFPRLILAASLLCWSGVRSDLSAQPQDVTAPTVSAVVFDGAESYVNISPAATTFGDFTISGWFNIGAKGGEQFLFRITNADGLTRRIHVTENAGVITADIRPSAGGTVYAVESSAFSYDTWFHFTFVREGDQLRLYFDGIEVGSETAVDTALVVDQWAYLGANTWNQGFGNPGGFLLGQVDEFQIWTVARTAQEIADTMNDVIETAEGLHARWGFNEGAGTQAFDSSGNDFTATLVNARWSLPAFDIINVQPEDGAIFVEAAEGLRFTIQAGLSGVDANDIELTLNGQDRSADLVITGTDDERQVQFTGLEPDRFYEAEIRATDLDGRSASVTLFFNTFNLAHFSWEAVDFNFDGGQFIDDPPIDWNIFPNYFDQIGIQGIDKFDLNDAGAKLYRFGETVGTDIGADFLRPQYVQAGLDDHIVTGVAGGEWLNYTRTFPAGRYHVYARLARNGPISARLELVTTDPSQPNQSTEPLGWFRSGGTGGAQAFEFIPMRDAGGSMAAIELDGVATLRVHAETPYNANYYLLVPATVEPPVVADLNPAPGTRHADPSAGITFSVVSAAGVSPEDIRFVLNGEDQTDDLVLSGDTTAWEAHYEGLLANELYQVEIQVVDLDGNDLGYPFTGTSRSNPVISFSFDTFPEPPPFEGDILFWDNFSEDTIANYTIEDSFGSGGSAVVQDGFLTLLPASGNTVSAMTTDPVTLPPGYSLGVDWDNPGKDGFLQLSTVPGQPDGTDSFGFRWAWTGSSAQNVRLQRYRDGGVESLLNNVPHNLGPIPHGATLWIDRLSETEFEFLLQPHREFFTRYSFMTATLEEAIDLTSFHIGVQGWASPPFLYDNLRIVETAAIPTIEPEVISGPFALQFDGSESYVDITQAAGIFGDFTISGWFNIGNKGSEQFLFRITNHEGATRRIQVTENEGTISADIRPEAGGTIHSLASDAFDYDTWFHVAFVREGAELRLYFNGQIVASGEAVDTELVVDRWAYLGANTWRSGPGFGNASQFFLGLIDEFQIWTVARSAQDIQNTFDQEIESAEGLHARWGFNERVGNQTFDTSGNDFTATVIEAAWVESLLFEPSDQPVLAASWDGVTLTLSWEQEGAQLEAASDIEGPWSTVEQATSPFVVDPGLNPQQFFRLRLPASQQD